MKSICFLIGDFNNSGGTERVTALISNELVRYGYEVNILSIFNGYDPFFEISDAVKIHSLYSKEVSFKINFLKTIIKTRAFLKAEKIDTLIVVDSISCIFTIPAVFNLNTKHICWEHFNFNDNNGVKIRDISRLLSARYCDYVVTLTTKDTELWRKGLKKINAKIKSIPNPSSYENIKHEPSLDFKVALAVGRLTYVKGFDMLINAWAIFCQDNSEWKLRIVGSGEEERSLKLQASILGISKRIDFIPVTKNIQKYYETSSYYCLSSRFEGFGLVMVEAQSFGLPVVAFNCDVGPSDIIENGINGYLVEKNDVSALACHFIYFSKIEKSNYDILSINSKAKNEKYSIGNIIQEWVDII
ncbi:GalNAc-alpha-(1-_4)-GalNAc-alpha-(1-_3)-diNAcBac-PP-undecaprenol alpha-1,4-N-acetyl-D-galactosaminyltransferase [Psychrobacter sp. SC65A.3]|nr:GalNAc-alpha-(1->4)-GalNAc-alpha-(1->3)-diNAcBac-PP-undecaprenol alpha-1,4-N-acetyl-D-galactosaminyltransferase [Psychrobacter sp. SC65A.3]